MEMLQQTPYSPPAAPDVSYEAFQREFYGYDPFKARVNNNALTRYLNKDQWQNWTNTKNSQWQLAVEAYNTNYNQYSNDYYKKLEAGLNPYWTENSPVQGGSVSPAGDFGSAPNPFDLVGSIVGPILSVVTGVADIGLKSAQAKKTNAEANFITESTPIRLETLGENYRSRWLGNNVEHWSQFGDSPNMLMTPGFYGGVMPGTYYDASLKGRTLQNTLMKQQADIDALPAAVRGRAMKMIQERTLNELGLLSAEQFKKSLEYDVKKLKSDIGFYKTEKVLGVVRSATGSISDLFGGVGNGIGGFLKGLKAGPARISNTKYDYSSRSYDFGKKYSNFGDRYYNY